VKEVAEQLSLDYNLINFSGKTHEELKSTTNEDLRQIRVDYGAWGCGMLTASRRAGAYGLVGPRQGRGGRRGPSPAAARRLWLWGARVAPRDLPW
jgi:hypothetical protein